METRLVNRLEVEDERKTRLIEGLKSVDEICSRREILLRGMYWQLSSPPSDEKKKIVGEALNMDMDLHQYLIERFDLIDIDRDQVLDPSTQLPELKEGVKQWITNKTNQLWLEHVLSL